MLVIFGVVGTSCAIPSSKNPASKSVVADFKRPESRQICATNGKQPSNSVEGKILQLVNYERRAAGMAPLCFSRKLAEVAREHNLKMAGSGSFKHRVLGEQFLLDRIDSAGIRVDHVAENIFTTDEPLSDGIAEGCVAMWMQSDGHRKNILSPELDYTGISISSSPRGDFYVTEDFAHYRGQAK